MVIDVFYILNELDLLEIRLNILDKYVDKFIIVESTETFSGISRELVYPKNEERFKKWKEKIIYYVVDDYPEDDEIYEMGFNSPNTNYGNSYWMREFYIKEAVRRIMDFKDDDIIFISDIDEIWNPELTYTPKGTEVIKPRQLPYIYYLNQRTNEDWFGWTGTVCTLYKTIKDGIINHLRTDDLTKFTVLENGGWHFNALGGRERKQDAWCNPGYDTFSNTVWERREKDMHIDEVDLPKWLLDNKTKYAEYFK